MSEYPAKDEVRITLSGPEEFIFRKFVAAWRYCYANPLPGEQDVEADRATILETICGSEDWDPSRVSHLNDEAQKLVELETIINTTPEIPPQVP